MLKVTGAICIVLVLALSASADLVRIGTIPAPGSTTFLSGLDPCGSSRMFAVANYYTYSILYSISIPSGSLLDVIAATDTIPLCPEDPPRYVSCAYERLSPESYYWVGDDCGAIIKYRWEEGELDTVLTTKIYGLYGAPWGMACLNDTLYVLGDFTVYVMDAFTGQVLEERYLEQDDWYAPGCLAIHDRKFYAIDGFSNKLGEFTMSGVKISEYALSGVGAGTATGLAFFGDSLYVSVSSDSAIYIYSLGSHGEDVPEGDSVEVTVIPDEVAVTFDSVAVAGTVYVDISETQPCPPPEGVTFFSDFYEMSTSATFDYTAGVALMTDEELPPGVNAEDVRVFLRPSGACTTWRDVTIAATEVQPPTAFRFLTRTELEEDEFSVLALAEDKRNKGAVARLKFGYLEDAIVDNEEYIPEDIYNQLTSLFTQAENAFHIKRIARANMLVGMIADLAADTPEIPHTYDPEGVTPNVAGKIMSRAHTLQFTLGLLMQSEQYGHPTAHERVPPVKPDGEFGLGLKVMVGASGARIRLVGVGDEPVSVAIYSVEGSLVRNLLRDRVVRGTYSVYWDGRNDGGGLVAPGTYFVVVRQGNRQETAKIVLR